MPDNLVVIPTYKEAYNVEKMVESVSSSISTDILFVDDNSPDGTGEILDSLRQTRSNLFVIHRDKKMGLASAYIRGFEWALDKDYQNVIQMDSDFSHDPKHLIEMLAQLKKYDLVIGSKYTGGGEVLGLSWWRAALSRYGNLYARTILKLKNPNFSISDITSGYLGWNKDLLEKIDFQAISSKGYAFLIELKWQAACLDASMTELPITFIDRVAGKSKLSPSIILEALKLPLHLTRFKTKGDP